MSTDADRMRLLEDGLDRIGELALGAWFDGSCSPGEVVEEAVFICEQLTEASLPPPPDEPAELAAQQPEAPAVDYSEIEAALPATWCPDLPLAQRVKNLVELRRAYLKAQKVQEDRMAELELKASELGDPPLAADPWAVVKMRRMLRNDPRSVILNGKLIKLLQHVFGVVEGPQVVQPTKTCPNCAGLGKVGNKMCVKCDGEAVIPDVDGLALRNAELELQVADMRDIIAKTNAMMLCMARNDRAAPLPLWEAVERALGDYRNNGYEYSDHPDDFTEPRGFRVNAPESVLDETH